MSKAQQQTLGEFTAGTTTETIVRTICLKLETSDRKNALVGDVVDEWQSMLKHMVNVMPSIPEREWSRNNTSLDRILQREFPDHDIKASTRQQAVDKAVEAYSSWASRGKPGSRPLGDFGDGGYISYRQDDVEIAPNDRGYGVKIGVKPYTSEWFHIRAGEYQREYLEGIVDGEYTHGSGELHLHDDGSLYLHLTVKHDVEVYVPGDVTRYVGVDLGENTIYAAAVVDSDGVGQVEMESGHEFRHHRDRLQEKKDRLQEQGDLRAVKELRGERRRYTDHVTHTASKAIVDLAEKHAPCAIRLEEMGNYRQTADDPIHDWPRGELAEKITYKAEGRGIPVEMVNPRNTSVTCRKCGQTTPEARQGDEFECRRCRYEVHADVNAAINIANGGVV